MEKIIALLFVIGFCIFSSVIGTFLESKLSPAHNSEDFGEALFLTPLIENGQIDLAREKAIVQHSEMSDVSSYAGYFTVNKEYNSNMFFWFFPAQENPKTAPVVLWLQGGPGATSLLGLFTENGPFIVTRNITLEQRKYSWHKNHNLIYIDNPVGTGYSFTDKTEGYAVNQTDVARDLLSALVQFFELFPELQPNEFFITGESYAGKYIPVISHAIKNYNMKAKDKINLCGLAIGNGFVDPVNQLVYSDFLYQIGLIDSNGREQFKQMENEAVELIEQGKYHEAHMVFDRIIDHSFSSEPSLFKNLTGFDFYFNYLQTNELNSSKYFTSWVQMAQSRKAIHVGNCTFHNDSTIIQKYLAEEYAHSVKCYLEDLLQHYKVMIYSGQLDIIVGYTLTENYIQKLNWPGAQDYKKAVRKQWKVGDDIAGYSKTVGNLIEVLVRNAGHMVPTDQPEWAWDMITKFTHHNGFLVE